MITEKDLIEAIAECQGTRNPNANTCMKLASYYVILDHIKEDEASEPPGFSFSSFPTQSVIGNYGSTEFLTSIIGMNVEKLMLIIDELMTAISVLNPKLYAGVMRKIAE